MLERKFSSALLDKSKEKVSLFCTGLYSQRNMLEKLTEMSKTVIPKYSK